MFMMRLCLETQRLGLGGMHARGQTYSLVGDFVVNDLKCFIVGD